MDLLRAVAISMVILLHVNDQYLNMYRYGGLMIGFVTFFKLNIIHEICLTGVPFFFMLSGALILKEDLFTKTFTSDIKVTLCIVFFLYHLPVFYFNF